jgi:hypothetical protein
MQRPSPQHLQAVLPFAVETDAVDVVAALVGDALLVRAEAEGPTVVHQHRHMALPLAEAAGSGFDRDGVVVTTEQAEGFAAVGAAG